MSLAHTFTGLLIAITVAVSLPAGAAGAAAPRASESIHGCGVLVPTRPWCSHVDGGTDEAGDHWIVDANRAHWSCSFARDAILRLVGLDARRYAGRDVGRLLGGLREWETKGLPDHCRPFQSITRHVTTSDRRHNHQTTVQAFIDPAPTFVHAASSGVRR